MIYAIVGVLALVIGLAIGYIYRKNAMKENQGNRENQKKTEQKGKGVKNEKN